MEDTERALRQAGEALMQFVLDRKALSSFAWITGVKKLYAYTDVNKSHLRSAMSSK